MKLRADGLCRAAVTLRAHQLVSTVCRLGGAECPQLDEAEAAEVLRRVRRDPTLTIRLVSPADEIPHYTEAIADDLEETINRQRDLDVLQRLGLLPGDTRRARYLYTLLFERIATPDGLCSGDTPGWEGCALAKCGAYERVRAEGWSAVVASRPEAECREYRACNAAEIARAERLYVRPHHLMCLACWYAGGEGQGPRPNDTLQEIHQRMREQPEVPVTLVEGCCMACECCEGYHPVTGRCVHAGGLIRDYKKDLDVFRKLGLFPGATLPAREVFDLLFARIRSTREICGYGNGIVRSEEWRICGDPQGNPGYEATRRTGLW